MPRLVALDLDLDDRFARALEGVLARGDAICVLDRRLSPTLKRAQLERYQPAVVLDADGEHEVGPGQQVQDGDALFMATSGSSGEPKVAIHTLAGLEASVWATTGALGMDPSRHRWLACLPPSHIGGLAVILRSVLCSIPLSVARPGDLDTGLDAALAAGATHTALVPTQLERCDPSRFEAILLGGAAPLHALPANVISTYGMTETASGVVYGGRALPGVQLGTDDDGELYLKGPMLLRCFDDGHDPRVTGPDGTPGWLPTGDLGAISPDGHLEVHGRRTEVINTGGEKVHPVRVEAALRRHPGVKAVAVWKRPDPTWGERVVAYVVPADPIDPPNLAALKAVAEVLEPWAFPKELVLLEELPMTASGKVARRLLD